MVKQPYIMPLSGSGSSRGTFVPVGSAWSWAEVSEVIAKGNVPLYVYVDNGHERLLSLADVMEGDAYKFSGVYSGVEYMVTLSQNDGWSSVSTFLLKDVFPVEYGVTPFADIVAAINEHMLPVLNVTENANTVSVYNLYNIYHSSGEISAVWFRKGIYEIGVIFDGLSATTYTPLPGELIRENLFWVENNGDHTGTALQDIYEAISNDMFIICQVGSRMFYVSDSDLDIPSMRFSSFDGKYFDITIDSNTGETYYGDIQSVVPPITFLDGTESFSDIVSIIMSGSIPVYLDLTDNKCYYGTDMIVSPADIVMRSGPYRFDITVDSGTGDTVWGSPFVDNSVYVTIDQGNINANKTFYIDSNGYVITTAWPLYQIEYGTTSIVDIVMAISDSRLPIMLYGGEAYTATAIDLSTYTLTLSCAGKKIVVTPDGSGGTNYSLPEDALVAVDQGVANAGKALVVDSLGKVSLQSHFEVFPVTYGTTTYAEIATALQNEMIPVMVYGDKAYVVSVIDSIEVTMTSCTPAGTYVAYVDTSNTWSNESKTYVQTAQGVANAGKFLVVDNNGIVVPVTMAQWTGGSY